MAYAVVKHFRMCAVKRGGCAQVRPSTGDRLHDGAEAGDGVFGIGPTRAWRAGMRRSSSLTTPISRWRSRACPCGGRGAIASKYRNAGQTCVCANRILVQDGVYDAFTKRLAETAGAMKVADGFEPGAVIGPLIDMKAVEKVEAHIADAVKKGANVVTGGKRAAQGGSFFEPTVLTDVTTDRVVTNGEPLVRWRRSTASRPTTRRSRWPTTPPP